MSRAEISFELVNDFLESGDLPIYRVYFARQLAGGKARFADILISLPLSIQKRVRRLIRLMAITENYRSPDVAWRIKTYPYGEIKPRPYRFFFFIRCGKNIVFFDYLEKKTNSLPDNI